MLQTIIKYYKYNWCQYIYIYLSIYLIYTRISRGLAKSRHLGLRKTLFSPPPSASCLFIGENTEGLPRSLASSLLVTFYDQQRMQWWYSYTQTHTFIRNSIKVLVRLLYSYCYLINKPNSKYTSVSILGTNSNQFHFVLLSAGWNTITKEYKEKIDNNSITVRG